MSRWVSFQRQNPPTIADNTGRQQGMHPNIRTDINHHIIGTQAAPNEHLTLKQRFRVSPQQARQTGGPES
jgi:hypothetical protein